MSNDKDEQIKKLEAERDGFVKSADLLRRKYKNTNAPRYKEMASKDLDEAQTRQNKINALKELPPQSK
jgi:hypothetical protein